MYDFLRAKSEMHARTLRSAEHALAFSETWSNTIIDFLMKINNLYTKVPVGTIVAIVSALIYFVSPVDFIPDFIPGIGQVDDAAVIVACLALVTADLDEYSVWRKKNGYTVEDMPDNLNEKEKSEFFKRMMREAKDPDNSVLQ